MAFHDLIGLRLVEKTDDGVIIEIQLEDQHMNTDAVAHGGVTATLVDAAVGIALQKHRPDDQTTTVEMKVNYLRPADKGLLRAQSHIVKSGRTLVVGTVDVTDEQGRHVAVGLLTYMILPRR